MCYKEVLQYQVMCLSEVYHLPGNTEVTQRQKVYFLKEDLYLAFATLCFPIHVCEGFYVLLGSFVVPVLIVKSCLLLRVFSLHPLWYS
jgi:hypothetical protein